MKNVIVAFLLFLNYQAFGQTHELSTALNFNRQGLFHGLAYTFGIERWNIHFGRYYGITPAIIQKTFIPRSTIGTSFTALKKNKHQLAPTFQYQLTTHRFGKSKQATVYFHDFLLGPKYRYGNRLLIGATLLVGLQLESNYSTLHQKRMQHTTFGYLAQIDFTYVF